MKNLRSLCTAVVLTLVLTLPAFAGQMQTTVTNPLPPSTATADGQISTMIAGQMHTGLAGQIDTMNSIASPVDPITQVALSLLQSLLPLF